MKRYKKSILFLIRFFGVYFLLLGVYSVYLNRSQQRDPEFKCASITQKVAAHSSKTLRFLGYDSFTEQHPTALAFKLYIDQKVIARVVEGCNSVSIFILFVSFIIAFSGRLKPTILFVLVGGLFIYFVNVLRIALLSILLYKFPYQQAFFHNLVFPAIIYGAVFLLWVLWVRNFSNLKHA